MSHGQYQEWLQLYLYNELGDEEKGTFEDHLKECLECQAELKEVKRLQAAFSAHRRTTLSHEMLSDARRQLRVALAERLAQQPLWERLIEPLYKISFSGVVILAVGFVVGYTMASAPQLRSILGDRQAEVVPILEGDSQITHVRFIDADASDGEVEFMFDVVTPVRLKGKMSDPQIQKVLAYALVNSQNPGVRLRTVNALSGQQAPPNDGELRTALLQAITSDANPAVRKEALALLQKLSFDDEIRDAVLHVLKHDHNSGVRIAAMMVLDELTGPSMSHLKDEEVRRVLQETIQTDDNNYVRLIARNILEESK